jgi:DNA-directed RNA polymerase subunit RPC12/RpoP
MEKITTVATTATTTIKCKHCSNEEVFKLGPNEGEDSLDKAKEHFKGKTKLHISSLQKKHKIDSSKFGYEILVCPNCQTLKNQYTVEVEYDQLMVFKPFYKCQQCGSTLEKIVAPLEENIRTKCCSSCGEKDLVIQ